MSQFRYYLILCLTLTASTASVAVAQTPWSTEVNDRLLQTVFPTADSFSDKGGNPPVYRAFQRRTESSEPALIGYVFLSADLPPEEKGYSAPIDMLIGLDLQGNLTGLKILNYIESYRYSRGDFLASEGFQAQFIDKSLDDDFRLHHDVDGVTNATISSWAISRGVRNAARRVAEAYLDYQAPVDTDDIWNAKLATYLSTLTWDDIVQAGLVVQKEVPTPLNTNMILSIAYMGQPAVGEFLVGKEDYAQAEREASIRFDTREFVMFAVGGDTSQPFQQQRLSFQQGDNPAQRIHPRRLVSAGSADTGIIAGKAEFAGAIVMEDDFDPSQPFSIFYQPLGNPEPTILRYQFKESNLALVSGKPLPTIEPIASELPVNSSWYFQLRHGVLWQDTDWLAVAFLAGLMALIMVAFWRKSTRLRWLSLTVTLAYLGFYNGGFLSVSHIAGLVAQGPGSIIGNFPLLLLVLFTLVTTFLWGRIFCASLCPFGAVQDFIARFVPKQWRIQLPNSLHQTSFWIKYVLLGLIIATAFINNRISIFQYFEPFGTLFFFSSSLLLWGILIAVLAGCIVIERFYCRYFCPLGAAVAIISVISPLRIKRVQQCNICKVCEHACPTGAIDGPKINFKECVRCDICEIKLINKTGSCKHSVAEIARRSKDQDIVKIIGPVS